MTAKIVKFPVERVKRKQLPFKQEREDPALRILIEQLEAHQEYQRKKAIEDEHWLPSCLLRDWGLLHD